jgi:hypothetical protein
VHDQVQGSLAIAVHGIRIRGIPDKQSGYLKVATPDAIVQRSVGLGIVALHVRTSTGTEQQLRSLESIVPSYKARAGHGKLQGKLAAPLQAVASRIWLSVTLQ